ncbi:hypothetical protein FF38_03450 [Lucilia cuprina]|uniref:Uncharacterized protein n=1 Tax=Lucilia cuprina TaxID=7375 RepID=A0A0L0C6I8_LUCCU|nr:hypothetical protein FF38_03450 [Lucilia cuprina]
MFLMNVIVHDDAEQVQQSIINVKCYFGGQQKQHLEFLFVSNVLGQANVVDAAAVADVGDDVVEAADYVDVAESFAVETIDFAAGTVVADVWVIVVEDVALLLLLFTRVFSGAVVEDEGVQELAANSSILWSVDLVLVVVEVAVVVAFCCCNCCVV